jgi:hypothetical protein
MGTKANPGTFDCHLAAHDDEPLFTLLGRDPTAALLVNLWAAMRVQSHGPSSARAIEASTCANDMVVYLQRTKPDVTPAGIATLLEAVVLLAQQCGAVVEITPTVVPPLAMGNYGYEVRAWAAKGAAA